MSSTNLPRCGVSRSNGRPCRQPTDDVWPCRYHDAASFDAMLSTVAGIVRDAGGWPALTRTLIAPKRGRR